MTIDIEQCRMAVGTYGKSVIPIKRARSYPFPCESYLHSILSLDCVILLYLHYALLGHTFNLFPFFVRSKINNLTGCCLSLHFLLILYFALSLSQHGDIEHDRGPKCFSICDWNLNSLTANNHLKVSQLQAFNLLHKFVYRKPVLIPQFRRITMHRPLKDTL